MKIVWLAACLLDTQMTGRETADRGKGVYCTLSCQWILPYSRGLDAVALDLCTILFDTGCRWHNSQCTGSMTTTHYNRHQLQMNECISIFNIGHDGSPGQAAVVLQD